MTQKPRGLTDAIAARICKEYASGKSLAKICDHAAMPAIGVVRGWLIDERCKAFHETFARARAALADHYADEIVEIADSDDPAKARVRIDVRKWAAARLAPRVYGDKVQHIGDGGGPIETKELSAGDIARRIAFLLEAARRDQGGGTGGQGDEKPALDSKSRPAK